MANPIVTVNVTQTVAPTPSTLQQTGAFISQGATNKAAQSLTLLTQLTDLTAILTGTAAITSITQAASVATVTTTVAHGFPNAEVIQLTIAGATLSAYNGTFNCTITGANTFTYPISGNPVSPAVGTLVYTPEDVAELLAMGTTFFAQGPTQGVYVLELGKGNAADGVTALTTFIAANPGLIYSYLTPRYWAAEPTFLTFLANYQATSSKTYFFVTMTLANYTSYTALMKDVFGLVEAPGIPATEFSLAAAFYTTLHYNPSNTNKVTPTAFAFQVGVTPYPTTGNQVTLAALKAAKVNYIGTGAEGGISNAVLFFGTTMDGNDFTYWYSVDWVQINSDIIVANAIINGSNNPINPLYYNQDGINRLSAALASMMNSGISFGLVLGNVSQVGYDTNTLSQNLNNGTFTNQTVVNAVPFVAYSKANPSDYKIGKYAGLAIIYTPTRGFTQITINVNVTQFVAQ